MPSVSLRMISNLSVCSSVSRYSVPPSALVIFLAASSMASSSRSRLVSLESAAPIWLSCSRPSRSLVESDGDCIMPQLLYTDCAHLRNISDTEQHFLNAVLFKGAHAFLESGRKYLRYPRVFLNILLNRVGAYQKLVQSNTAFVPGFAASIAARGDIEHYLALIVAELVLPAFQQLLPRRFGIFFPCLGVHELDRVLLHQQMQFFFGRRVRLLTFCA